MNVRLSNRKKLLSLLQFISGRTEKKNFVANSSVQLLIKAAVSSIGIFFIYFALLTFLLKKKNTDLEPLKKMYWLKIKWSCRVIVMGV